MKTFLSFWKVLVNPLIKGFCTVILILAVGSIVVQILNFLFLMAQRPL